MKSINEEAMRGLISGRYRYRSLFEDGPAAPAAPAGNIQTSGSIAAQPEHLGVYGVKKKVVTGIGKVNKGGKKQKRVSGLSLR